MARIYTRQEVKRRKMKYQVFAGMFDFVGILAGMVVIIACAILISSLWDIFTSAIIIPD